MSSRTLEAALSGAGGGRGLEQLRPRILEAKVRSWLAAPEQGETLPDPDQGPEADMDEPEDEEPTTAEMNEFFDAITASG